MTAPIIVRLERGVLWIGLNRPERYNAYNLAMRDALYEAFGLAAEHPDVGAVIVHGEGDHYSAGADLTEFGSAPSQDVARRVRFARDVWGRVLDCSRPIIAALHGYCLGSGLELALLCDQRIAADDAVLGLPEIKLGMIPAAGGTQSAPRVAGLGHASALLLSGERIAAGEAMRHRLVEEVVPRAQLRLRAGEIAEHCAGLAPDAVLATRDALRRGLDLPLAAGLALERRLARRVWEK